MRTRQISALGVVLAVAAASYAASGGRAQPRNAPAETRKQKAKAKSANAEQTPASAASLRSETRLITVDVSVRDKHGNAVRGLKPSDFRIFDNGRGPQQIAAFRFIETAAPAPSPIMASAAAKPGKTAAKADPVYSNEPLTRLPVPPTAILLDPGNIAFSDQLWAREEVMKLLDSLPENTPTAVLLLAGSLTVVQNFTTNRALLRDAVNRSMLPLAKPENPQGGSGTTPSFSGRSETGATHAVDSLHDFEKLEYEEQNTVIADQTSDAMKAIAKDLEGYPGQKNLVWISEAFPQWILPGAGFGPDSDETGHAPLGNPFRQTFEASSNFGDKLKSDAQALVNARVTVYPVDPRGLVAPGLYDASSNILASNPEYAANPAAAGPAMGAELSREDTDLTFSQATMEQIAHDTGGTACTNTNDLAGCAKSAIVDSTPDYEISYYPAGVQWDGSFHRITLKTDLHGARIRYRSGYSAVDTTELAKRQPMDLFKEACASLLPGTSIGLRAEALRAPRANESRYLLSISPSALSVTPSGNKLALRLRLGVCEYAPRGGRFHIYLRDLTKKFSERDAEKWQKQDVQNVIDFKAKPDAVRLRLAVLDTSTGLTGSVDVPAHPRVVFDVGGLDDASERAGAAGAAELYSSLEFHSTNGDSGGLDLSGGEIKYRGTLPVELAAPAFFHEVYGRKFQCEAGRLVSEGSDSRKRPNFRFAFKNADGLLALVDLAGAQPTYAGSLPVGASARAFFERLWKLCHCQAP